ncbi:MAG: 3-deoxy-7-phosphoheptulonate synthase [Chitinivibrionales bacterium]
METNTGMQSGNRITPMVAPRRLTIEMPPSQQSYETVLKGRREVSDIIEGRDDRLLAIVGPCSIHDIDAAREYAVRLRRLQLKLSRTMVIVMRVYLEKPRTVTGWKGLINDPDLDDSCDIAKGIHIGRDLLLEITEMGLPVATEILDPLISYYLGDLISWASIGARTTESQVHRQVASGLSMPVGFKNGTSGSIAPAICAIRASRKPHTFLGTDREGRVAAISTGGNSGGHLVLRGGNQGPNYSTEQCRSAICELEKAELNPAIIIDCSHENSARKYLKQVAIAQQIAQRKKEGEAYLRGIMIESNLVDGAQKLGDARHIICGMSVTDPCLGWEKTERLLNHIGTML